MKTLLLTTLSLAFTFTVSGQQMTSDTNGFTNKAEAKNQMVNGLKDGKWLEYYNQTGHIVQTDRDFYRLTMYKAGNPIGTVREYYNSGNLYFERTYANGKLNGVAKDYYLNGKLKQETPYTDGKVNGMTKAYYKGGSKQNEIPYTMDKLNGVQKWYYESGVLQYEKPFADGVEDGMDKEYTGSSVLIKATTYQHGKVKEVKEYDITGKEIKK